MIAWCLGVALAGGSGLRIGDVPHGLGTTWGIVDDHGEPVSAETFAFLTGDQIKVSEIRDFRRLHVDIGIGLATGGAVIGLGGGFLGYAVSRNPDNDAGLLLAAALLGTGLGVAGFAVAATGTYESGQVARFYERSEVEAKLAAAALPRPRVQVVVGPFGVAGRF